LCLRGESPFLHTSVALAALTGLLLLAGQAWENSATYDEVLYLKVAARWWRTGEDGEITRVGSPRTFWKLQQAPVLFAIDRLGHGHWIDHPIGHQADLLPWVRLGGSWTFVVALLFTAAWARRSYGPRAAILASWLFALSPNLLAHGALATMEGPLVACVAAMLFLFWRFLATGSRPAFVAAAAVGGLAFSCKFTTALLPPILALAWWVDRWRSGERRLGRLAVRVMLGMLGFVAVLGLSNLVVTGGATVPLSPNRGAHGSIDRVPAVLRPVAARIVEAPVPADLAGFATQLRLQGQGGSSYLLGERRGHGWRHYYLVTLAVKVPLAFWALFAARGLWRRSRPATGDALVPVTVGAFLAITSLASTRNYGIRYLLPIAPAAIVWVSALAEARAFRAVVALAIVGQAWAVGSCHPHELAYFNALAGGSRGGRRVLADSNLDWGQGCKSLARLQRDRPELRDLTLFYFGDTDPAHYGVAGRAYVLRADSWPDDLPPRLAARSRYVAVSASLQYGPWGPPGYFLALDHRDPVAVLDDASIAIYRVIDGI
jgi:4-amino-4-deoxy-L-arabinose transferase-like glycosyltransferase